MTARVRGLVVEGAPCDDEARPVGAREGQEERGRVGGGEHREAEGGSPQGEARDAVTLPAGDALRIDHEPGPCRAPGAAMEGGGGHDDEAEGEHGSKERLASPGAHAERHRHEQDRHELADEGGPCGVPAAERQAERAEGLVVRQGLHGAPHYVALGAPSETLAGRVARQGADVLHRLAAGSAFVDSARGGRARSRGSSGFPCRGMRAYRARPRGLSSVQDSPQSR
jgi:hypothetical protein